MNRTLVVVTCYRDLGQLLIMFRSIHKFLQPSNIVIVINEDDTFKWSVWFDKYQKYLSAHNVQVYTKADLLPILNDYKSYTNSWLNQQVLKLLISSKITTQEYVILDSKNFFIKDTNLADITSRSRDNIDANNGSIPWISNIASSLRKLLTTDMLRDGRLLLQTPQTPYIMNTEYVTQLIDYYGGPTQFIEWFYITTENIYVTFNATNADKSFEPFISEFYLYELFCGLHLLVDVSGIVRYNNWVFWARDNIPAVPIGKIPEHIYVGGIHKKYIDQMPQAAIDAIYNYFEI
jgi:hypothetical protein